MYSQWIVPIVSALIGGAAMLGSAKIQQPDSGFAGFICSNSISITQERMNDRLKIIESENSKLKQENQTLSDQLRSLEAKLSLPEERPFSNTTESFQVTSKSHQKILNGEILLENFRIYQDPLRRNSVDFDLNFNSKNIPDYNVSQLSNDKPFEFKHRDQRYKIYVDRIVPEDGVASLVLKLIE